MNIKKANLGSVSMCALLVSGVAMSFATSAQAANSCPAVPTSMSCSNLPTFPKSISCSNLPAAPVIPACPAAPKQVDFATALPSNALSTYANEYSFKWGRMPDFGETGFRGASSVRVSFSKHLETDPSGIHAVYQWDLFETPANYTMLTESIVYVEYPNYPRDPAVQDIMLDTLNSTLPTLGAGLGTRYRQLTLGCKATIAPLKGGIPGTSVSTQYTYLISNNPSATYMVYGTSGTLPAQNCTIKGLIDRDYNTSSDGATAAHMGPT